MHRRIAFILVSWSCLLLVVGLTGCRHSSATPILSTASTGGQASPVSTGAELPYPQPTTGVNPQPTLSGNVGPTIYQYPKTTSEGGYPSPVETTPTVYPAPVESVTPGFTPTPKASATQNKSAVTPTVTSTSHVSVTTAAPASSTPTVTGTSVYPGPGATETSQYPGPGETATEQYPGPGVTGTPIATQEYGTATPFPSPTPTFPPGTTPTTGLVPTSPSGTGTPAVTPAELPSSQPLAPPPAGSNVTIWCSWTNAEQNELHSIIQSFQRLYPNVTFNLVYIPQDDLFTTYQQAAYIGQGPSLLLGPAKWGFQFFDGGLITDLYPYVSADYLARINPAALDSAKYHQALISLPLSQSGVVMFRNTSLIATAAVSFTDLITLSHAATKAGVVGSYLERGAYFSSANLLGLGGSLLDSDGLPAFDDQYGLNWIDLLRSYSKTGAVTFNTNWDLDRFKRGQVGIIIDGTWDIQVLRDAIGSDKLAIDPWPTYGDGHMSGWVQVDSVFLNANLSGDDRFAALSFMGYLLDPQVQQRLAELGHIPSIFATKPRDPLIQQAMDAFSNGVAYPISIDESSLSLYWNALDRAIRSIFVGGENPADALQAASDNIKQAMLTSTPVP